MTFQEFVDQKLYNNYSSLISVADFGDDSALEEAFVYDLEVSRKGCDDCRSDGDCSDGGDCELVAKENVDDLFCQYTVNLDDVAKNLFCTFYYAYEASNAVKSANGLSILEELYDNYMLNNR